MKVRTLDAICAKLKSLSGEEGSDVVSELEICEQENNIPLLNESDTNNAESFRDEILESKKYLIDKESEKKGAGSSRRKSRKAAAPRNIAQVREILDKLDCADENDELAEYEINNQNTDFPPEEDVSLEEEDSIVRKDSAKTVHNDTDNSPVSASINNSLQNRKQSRKPLKSTQSFSTPGNTAAPLDLSVAKSTEDSDHSEKDFQEFNQSSQSLPNASEHQAVSQLEMTSNPQKSASSSSSSSSKFKLAEKSEKQEMTVLKDYAESTMNELLSMYGFSAGSGDSLVQQIPSNNFTSNQILHKQSPQPVPKVQNSKPIPPLIPSPTTDSVSPDTVISTEKKGIYTSYVSPSVNKISQSNKNAKNTNNEGKVGFFFWRGGGWGGLFPKNTHQPFS